MFKIIWNLTRKCVWDCKICCVCAYTSPNLNQRREREELSFKEKLRIIDALPDNIALDFSGGDLIIDKNNLKVIERAAGKYGRENIGVSISGAGLTCKVIDNLVQNVHEIELSLDMIPEHEDWTRPMGYHETACKAVHKLKDADVRISINTVLKQNNTNRKELLSLFSFIKQSRIDEWSILRYYPSGKGFNYKFLDPGEEIYKEAIDYLKFLNRDKDIDISFQHTFGVIMGKNNVCRAGKESVGILPDGFVVSCFWALDTYGDPVDNHFVLGNLRGENMEDIFKKPAFSFFQNYKGPCQLLGIANANKQSEKKKALVGSQGLI